MIGWLYDKLLRPIFTAHDSPEAVAGGVALGLGIALTPTLGVQMPLALLLATLVGGNRVAAVAMVWVSNPLTALPLYYGEYELGSRMLGRTSLSFRDFSERWSEMSGLGYLERFKVLFNVLTDVAVPLLVGSFTAAIIVAALAYPLSLAALRRSRRVRAARAGAAETSVALLLLALVSLGAQSGCTEPPSDGEIQGVVAEAEVAERHPLAFARPEGGELITLRPFQLSGGHQEFTRQRFDEMLGIEDCTYLALDVYGLGDEGQEALAAVERFSVSAQTSGGRIRSLEPSNLLARLQSDRDRAVLGPLLGSGGLPEVRGGQALHLLVVLPRSLPWAELSDWRLERPQGDLELSSTQVFAERYETFRAEPSPEAFESACVAEAGDEAEGA